MQVDWPRGKLTSVDVFHRMVIGRIDDERGAVSNLLASRAGVFPIRLRLSGLGWTESRLAFKASLNDC